MNQVEASRKFITPITEGLYYIKETFKTGNLVWHEGSNANLINRGKFVIIKDPASDESNYLEYEHFSKLTALEVR